MAAGNSMAKDHPPVPKELKWDLMVRYCSAIRDYIDNLVPFNWRGWWQFGTGALGDMACHIIGPSFKLLQLGLSNRSDLQRQYEFIQAFLKKQIILKVFRLQANFVTNLN